MESCLLQRVKIRPDTKVSTADSIAVNVTGDVQTPMFNKTSHLCVGVIKKVVLLLLLLLLIVRTDKLLSRFKLLQILGQNA